jgi:hypothetical protein
VVAVGKLGVDPNDCLLFIDAKTAACEHREEGFIFLIEHFMQLASEL